MTEATYFDLLGTLHYTLILVFLMLFGFSAIFLKSAIKKRKKLHAIAISVGILLILVAALIVRQSFFPGGGLYDPTYEFVRHELIVYQEYLDQYKILCAQYPTTTQGLGALASKPAGLQCEAYVSQISRIPIDIKYTSTGQNYEVISTRKFTNQHLIVRGTSEFRAKLFIDK